ncbi:MAG: sigma 54-interacting transcriptional regulator [Chlorobium sp.]
MSKKTDPTWNESDVLTHSSKTIFLDELGKLPPQTQVRLLSVLPQNRYKISSTVALIDFHAGS